MKKISLKRIIQRKATKRTVSGLTALALLLGVLPVGDIKTGVEKLGDLTLTAFAADDPVFKYTTDKDGNHNIDVYPSQLVDYSKDCQAFPDYHQDDHILITSTGNEAMQVFNYGFAGIGTDDYPFSGTIEIGANNEEIVLNIDAPLFNAVYNDVTLTNNGGNFKIARAFDSEQTQISETNRKLPLLAKNIVSGSGEPATWNIEVVSPTDGDDLMLDDLMLKDFGGFIGNIAQDTSLTVNVTMNGSGDTTDNLTVQGNGDTGLICGYMSEGSVLDFSLITNRKINSVTTENGHVGGLVGRMQNGAVLNYSGTNIINNNADIKTSTEERYAGGLVGYNEGGTVNITLPDGVTAYPIKQYMEGTAGAGGIFGYYRPGEPEETDNGDGTTSTQENSIDVNNYEIDCRVNGIGYDGGLFGVLETDHDYSITGTSLTSSHASGSADGYGGLIGRYANSDLSNKLTVGTVTATSSKGSATYYGGGIAVIGDSIENNEVSGGSCYVKYDSFTAKVAGANSMTFGGLVSIADNAFVDANNVTVNVTNNSYRFKGGGVVGSLKSGVLRMSGTTDLSNTYAEEFGFKGGQIVGYRDNALIFGTDDWQLKRGTVSYTDNNNNTIYIKADDIGSWGEVLRFDGKNTSTEGQTSYGYGTDKTVVTVNETEHYATVGAPSYDDNGNISVGSVSDLAKAALNMQMNDSQYDGVLRFEDTSNTSSYLLGMNITLTGDISLKGTGITGFTRDNSQTDTLSADKCVYTGTLDGGSHAITLAIGEPYGYRGDTQLTDHSSEGNGKIYHHKYNGLFGIVDTSSSNPEYVAKDLTIKGTADVYSYINGNDVRNAYVGCIAGRAKGDFKVKNIIMTDAVSDGRHETAFNAYGGGHTYVGGLLGQASAEIGDISVEDCNIKCNIQTGNSHGDSCFGGLIGWIAYSGTDSKDWSFSNVTVSGEINNTHERAANKLGGLVAAITEYNGADSQRAVNLTNISIDRATIKAPGSGDSTMGGMLGYTWHNVNTTFHNVEVKDSTVEMTAGNGDMAGLVYQGTGYWKVEPYSDTNTTAHYDGIKINDLTVKNSNAKSFGMIVNHAKTENTALYLEILADDTTNSTKAYNIASANLDELKDGCVFDEIAAYTFTDNVGKNGQAVISIHSDDFKTDGTSASGTYHAQTARGAVPNPNARYYYNIDTIKNGTESADLLMRWALHQYAHSSISNNFTNEGSFSDLIIPNDTYDMQNYSWYPVDVSRTVTVNGTFKFYNKEFEDSEALNGGTYPYKRTSIYDSTNNSFTQHKFMHAGLFRDVTGTLNVGDITLSGNVGRIRNTSSGTNESGALVCGWVKGSNASSMATVNVTGTIALNGVYINGFDPSGQTDYAPLLINLIREYSNNIIAGVTTSGYSDDFKAASSLIGDVGTTDDTNITLTFKNMKLDGRTTSGAYSLDSVYGTKSSIFTRATFLNSFKYSSGSAGSYDFNLADDWTYNSGTYSRASGQGVTYGSEISDSTNHNQYYGKEFWYKDTIGTIYTNYDQPTLSGTGVDANKDPINPAPVDFSGFLPYVYDASTAANAATEKKYQIKVNHAVAQMTGCGTYNDPYIITSGDDLNNIAEILNGNAAGKKIALPNVYNGNTNTDFNKLKVKKWDDFGHSEFSYDGTNFINGDSKAYSLVNVQTYLAGAYYKIEENTNIELPSDFIGLGNTETYAAFFRGVIVGKGETITLKGSAPLIHTSYGSVIRNVRINVDCSNITVSGKNADFKEKDGCGAYGAVIGQALGGDNIIDNVSVGFSDSTTITVNGAKPNLAAVGGYVGVITYGSLIFRNMPRDPNKSEEIQGIPSGSTIVRASASETDLISETNMKWLYVNPIVGRVINAAVFTESDAYRPFEDGTRDYVGEGGTTTTKTWSDGAVTMRNGTKNYSIADLKKPTAADMSDRLYVSEYTYISTNEYTTGVGKPTSNDTYKTTLDIPDAQTLFILSMLIQGKMTTTWYQQNQSMYYNQGGTGGYGEDNNTFKTTHLADYNYVGSDNSEAQADCSIASGDTYIKERDKLIPYFVEYYTKPQTVNTAAGKHGVFNISNGGTICDMTWGGTPGETWYMPDGFKGIGCIYKIANDPNLNDVTMSINRLDGNDHVIDLNMSLNHYLDGSENYQPASVGGGAGFALFNTLRQNRRDRGDFDDTLKETSKYKDFTITGSVNYHVYKTNGNIIDYINNNSNAAKNQYVNVGAFAGHFDLDAGSASHRSCVLNMENVKLKNMEVNGVYRTGGFIGLISGSGNEIDYHRAYITNCSADNLVVTSGIDAGGFVGVLNNYSMEFNGADSENNNGIYDLVKVISYSKGGNSSDNGTGGIIGYIYNNDDSCSATVRNIDIGINNESNSLLLGFDPEVAGTDNLSYFNSSSWTDQNSGGVVGLLRGRSLKVEKCNVYNANIYGHRVGGILGASSNDRITVKNIEIYDTRVMTNNDAQIFSYVNDPGGRAAGGLIGTVIINNADKGLYVNNCLVKNYSIKMRSNTNKGNNRVGGICGGVTTLDSSAKFSIANTMIDGCRLCSSKGDVGGLVGFIGDNQAAITGYNILTRDIEFTRFDGFENYNRGGHIVGYAKVPIKIAGFSRRGTIYREQMNGNYDDNNANKYGSGGYVVFADYYNMTGSGNMSTVASTVNDTNNVAQRTFKVDDQTADTANNFPYVTVSPKRAIESGDDGKFLTGDAVISLTYADSMFKKILDENSSNMTGCYKNYKATNLNTPTTSIIMTDELAAKVKAQFSTSAAQVPGSGAPNIPLIVIEDTDYKAVTQVLNSYINVLANTSGYNYANDDSIHRVELRKCSYDKSTGEYTIGENKTAALKKQSINGYDHFRMTAANVDNAVEGVLQFSLLDVQFLNPSNTEEVAYHLYIPVYVKKLLQYDFKAAMLSNTDYSTEAYGTLNGNSIFENLGNPLTMKLEYNYTRTTQEWIDAINGGDNVLNNLYKTINVSGGAWPEGTRMVLVDANNKDKAYYLDSPGSASVMQLYDFTDETGAHYRPAPLGNLMDITIGQPSDISKRTLTPVSVDTTKSESEQIAEALDAGATVYADGKFYRPINEEIDTELDVAKKYAVTAVSNIQPERYYLSIFTPKSDDTKIYHYQFTGSESFAQRQEGDIYDGYRPNHITKANAVVHLYIGDLYENTFTMTVASKTGDREMSISNNCLKVSMTSTVKLKSVATEIDDEAPSSAEYDKTRKGIAQNMQSNAATSEIYQIFLSTYDKKDTTEGSSNISINMQAPPFAIVKKYNYYKGTGTDSTPYAIECPDPNDYITENYVQLINNKNIVSDLGNAANGYAVTFDLEYELNYYDENDLPAQFSLNAEKRDDIGTKVIGYSNISSSKTNVAYSATSQKNDTASPRYYVSDSAQAELNYNVVQTTGEMSGPYSYLGINPLDEPETEHLIKTLALYDTHNLKNSGDYIEFSIKLSKRSDYSKNLPIDNYIKNLKITDANNDLMFDSSSMSDGFSKSSGTNKYLVVTRTDTEYKIRVLKDFVQKQGNDDSGRYLFPIEFTVYTGDEKFNNEELMYSNYKVSVHAEMWSAITGGTESDPSNADNYLIYTNAKVDPDVIR